MRERIWWSVDRVNLIKRLPLVGLVCCLVTLATGCLSLWNTFAETQADTRRRLADLGLVLAEQAGHHVQIADILLRNVQARARALGATTQETLVDAFASDEGRRYLTLLIPTLPPTDGVALFDARGDLIGRGRQVGSFSISDRPYFTWLRDHPGDDIIFAGPWISRATGVMSFYAARRLSGADGAFLGVAVAGLTTGYFSDFYRSLAQTRDFGISLLRADGTLLVRYPPVPGTGGDTPVTVRPGAAFFDAVARGGDTFRTPGFLIDHQTITSVHPVPGYPLVLDVERDFGDLLRSWAARSLSILLLTPALAVAVLVLFLSLHRAVRAQEIHAAELADNAAALRANEERLDRAQEIAGLGSWEQDAATGQNIWSRNLYRIRGIDPAADISEAALMKVLPPDEYATRRAWLAELGAGRQPPPQDIETQRPDGTSCILRIEGRAIVDPDGMIRRLAGTTRDVTQLRLLERGLIQSQKMEAIGNLAGGIAHDFNNMLGVIIGNLDLLRTLVENGSEAADPPDEALDGATRGADLVKRLLAFARNQPLEPQSFDVNRLVADAGRLLRRALGESVVLRVELGEDVGSAFADPVQLQASLVNLGTNARDAMPNGGRLQISTQALVVTEGEHHDDVPPGNYAVVTVRDTGAGMEPEVLKRIFEPFFTTKAPEKGSGLGLAMVFGFVNQSGGHLAVRSEPGAGSSFRLYLPRASDGDAAPRPAPPHATAEAAGEIVLLVDDNPAIRRASIRQLSALGYRVREAVDAAAALRILQRGERIDILLTDLVLSGAGDGLDLAEAAVRLRPDMHVVLMSGWFGIRDAKTRLARWGRPLLGKPFFTDELAAALRGELVRPLAL